MPSLFTGMSDGVVEEITAYPQFARLGYDVATKKEIREGLWNRIKKYRH